MFGAEVTVYSTFDAVADEVIEQAHEGVRSMAQAVLEDAKSSMKFGGLPQHRPKRGQSVEDSMVYESAMEGEPPRYHSGKFKESLDIAIEGGRVYAGSKSSDVGLRGSWFEFGNRPLKPGEKMHPRQRRWKQHPWLGPALDRQFDTFVPRVVGTFTS